MIRFYDWWNYKTAPMLCFVYFFISVNDISLKTSLISIPLFLLWILGAGGTGHVLNDIADIRSDKIADKTNYMSSYSCYKRIMLILFLVIIAFIPWIFLPINIPLAILILSEYILFIIYSFPPFRLKESLIGGIIADALYGHALIILISALTFYQIGNPINIGYTFFIFLFVWQLLKGFRNILLHQIDDRKNDKRSGTNTFVVRYGSILTINLINRVVLPLELIIFSVVLGYISLYLEKFYIAFVVFLIFTCFKFSLWKIFKLPQEHFKQKFLFFLNDFYEEWMPVIVLLYLVKNSFGFIFLLVIHFFLFYSVLENFIADIKTINTNIHEQINENRLS